MYCAQGVGIKKTRGNRNHAILCDGSGDAHRYWNPGYADFWQIWNEHHLFSMFITSLFGFLPVCAGLAVHLFKEKENQPKLMQWIMAIFATAVLGFLLINLPEAILSSENTPYEFTDRGYYEKYGEQYEQDNGCEYFVPEAEVVSNKL